MKTEISAMDVTGAANNHLDTEPPSSQEFLPERPYPVDPGQVDPGRLEQEHARLLQMQGNQTDDVRLVEKSRELVSHIRQLGRRLEDSRLRQHWQGILTYWSIFAYRAGRVDLDSELLPFDRSLSASFRDDQSPYRFDESSTKEAQETLAWRRLLDECEQDLAGDQLLTVVGEVGSGRKFLLFELLLPLLRSGRARRPELADSSDWRYITVSLGKDPIRDLIQAIGDTDGRDANWVAYETHAVRMRPGRLLSLLDHGSDRRTLLTFERFSSLLKSPADERAVLVDALAALLDDPAKRYFVAVTLRPRHTHKASQFGPLEHRLHDGHVLLAFTTAELRHLIEEPAERIGLVFDHGLIDQIMIDIQGENTSLPLLQFTLRRLWAHRERNRITREAYRKVGAGTNALRIAMDEVYNGLDDHQKPLFQKIVLAMVSPEPDGSFVSSEISQDDLYRIFDDRATVDPLIGLLRDQGLLHERTVGDEQLLTLNNNAILSVWPPLVAWLDEVRIRDRFRMRLKEAANLWQTDKTRHDLLWRGALLAEADQEFLDNVSLTTPEKQFLEAGRQREALKRRKRNIMKLTVAAAVLAVLVTFPLALLHHDKRERLSQNAVSHVALGDLSGALVWLNEKGRGWDLPFLGRRAQDEKIRLFAQAQLPELEFRPLPNVEAPNLFEDISVSQDGTYAATVRLEAPDAAKKEKVVEVTSLHGMKPTLLKQYPIFQPESSTGCVAFAKHSTRPLPYLLAGIGPELWCWRVEASQPENWAPIPLELPAENRTTSVVDLEVANDLLAVIRLTETGQRSLSLFQLTIGEEQDDKPLQLRELDMLDGLKGLDVQLAALSTEGDLVVVAGPEQDQATILMAWRKLPGRNQWTLAVPSARVIELNKNQRQRLYDFGWTLTDDANWQRDSSFVRALCFSQSGKQFITASDDGQVLAWEFRQPEANRAQAGTRNADVVAAKFETEIRLGSSVYDVAFINDDVIVTGGRDRTARIWDLHSGAEIAPRTSHEGTLVRVEFVPKHDAVVTLTGKILRKWTSEEYANIVRPTLDRQYTVAQVEDSILVTEIPNRNHRDRLIAGTGGSFHGEEASDSQLEVFPTAWSPDRKWVCTTYQTNGSFSVDIRRISELGRAVPLSEANILSGFVAPPLIEFSSDARRLVVAEKTGIGGAPPRVQAWDLTINSPKLVSVTAQLHPLPSSIATAPFRSMSFNTLTIRRYINVDVLALAGRQALTAEKERGVIYFGTLARDKNDTSFELKSVLLTTEASAEKSPAVEPAYPHDEAVLCAKFSPRADLLATGDKHDRVKLWDVEELLRLGSKPERTQLSVKPLKTLEHSSDVKSLAFSTEKAALLATVSSEGEASIWSLAGIRAAGDEDVKTPQYKVRHDAKILDASFSPSGEALITGGLDCTARVWSLRNARVIGQGAGMGPELVALYRHVNPVVEVTMPRDDQVETVSRSLRSEQGMLKSKQTRTWTIPNEPPLATAKVEQVAARRASSSALDTLDAGEYVESTDGRPINQ